MMFWDTSAIVPLLVSEPRSAACRAALAGDREIAVWSLARTEATSAIRRREREGHVSRDRVAEALRRLKGLESAWTEVDALSLVRDRADRLLGVHALRAADALQLAAALVLVEERPTDFGFVCADGRLADAAEAEGFTLERL